MGAAVALFYSLLFFFITLLLICFPFLIDAHDLIQLIQTLMPSNSLLAMRRWVCRCMKLNLKTVHLFLKIDRMLAVEVVLRYTFHAFQHFLARGTTIIFLLYYFFTIFGLNSSTAGRNCFAQGMPRSYQLDRVFNTRFGCSCGFHTVRFAMILGCIERFRLLWTRWKRRNTLLRHFRL